MKPFSLRHYLRRHRHQQAPAAEVEINPYGRQLTAADIRAQAHREMVGGLWDEMGLLQLEFLKNQGLQPGEALLDVGCGALRGGIHFIRFLETGRYYGLDINASLIKAGELELKQAGLADKEPHLLVTDKFEARRFGRRFKYALAQSVFTHLPMNHIIRCLVETGRVLETDGRFFATFFEAPVSAHLVEITRPGNFITHYDKDAFHYSMDEFKWMARAASLNVALIGDWQHPRDQKMLSFSRHS